MRTILGFSLLICALSGTVLAGNTGKVSGKIVDEKGEPLPSANVTLQGTSLGASSDPDGNYFVLNVPPGKYTLVASMVGYRSATVSSVEVSADFTTRINLTLRSATVDLSDEVVVVAERPLVVRDRTSTAAVVSAERIEALPVNNVQEVLQLQAGVIIGADGGIHIRGGRATENQYMVNGISTNDPYSGLQGVQIENNGVQELSVVSGTFNAEYGQAQSGVINIVTKEGGNQLSGSLSLSLGSYFTPDQIYANVDRIRPTNVQDYQASVGGPVPLAGDLTFFLSGRYVYDEGYLYGQRWFNVGDSSDFSSPTADQWSTNPTGDGASVAMNPSTGYSLQGSLKYPLSSLVKLSLFGSYSKEEFRLYDHNYKYDPDGDYQRMRDGNMLSLSFTHMLSEVTFYEIKAARVQSQNEQYVFSDPLDPRYPPDGYSESKPYNFHSGGAKSDRLYRTSTSYVVKAELSSQLSGVHFLKAGAEGQSYRLQYEWFRTIVNDRTGFTPSIDPEVLGPFGRDQYDVKPVQLAAYAQDKMELEDMIINLGLRFDYFNSEYVVPVEMENPTTGPKRDASAMTQFSPRLGIAYPISDRGVLHFSWGHFFQIPPFEYLYANPDFEVVTGSLQSIVGNAELKPEQTIAYEIGLQQQLAESIVLNVTAFYKDIRNLLGTEIFRTDQQTRYARYKNQDYGNVRGVTLALTKHKLSDLVGATVDYTYTVAEGNSSDPESVFLDNISIPPIESEVQMLPLDWDQTHTINATVTVAQDNWGVSLIGRFGSGLPYTPTPFGRRSTTFPLNSETKPKTYTVDMQAEWGLSGFGMQWSLFLKVFNLFDTRNEVTVYGETGRAGYTIIPGREEIPVVVSTLDDYLTRPDFYSSPRLIKLGVLLTF